MRRRTGNIILALLPFLFIPVVFAEATSKVPAEERSTCVQLLHSNASGLELEVNLNGLIIESESASDENRFKLRLEGESAGGAPGYPDLPSISRLIAIPPETGVSLEWDSDAPRIITGCPPVDAPGFPQSSSQGVKATINTGLWPAEVVSLGAPVILRGVRMVEVTIHPVQYEASTGRLYLHDNIQVKLNFTAQNVVNPLNNPARPRPSSAALKLARSLVLNPQDIHRDQDEGQGSFIYVIPSFNGVAEAIQPLVEWRRRQGYPTQVLTVANNASNVEIRNQLREAYFNWDVPPEIITLVGDGDLVNANFMIPAFDVGRAYMWETDYQYALLEGNDLIPEAAVGRISARSLAELRNVVDKIVGYEVNPFMDDPRWFTRAALMTNDPRTGYSTMYLSRWARNLLLEVGFAEVDTFYFIHENQITGHQFILQNFNQGISLFNYRGWGQFNGDWVVGDVRELRNDRMLPLLILPTCNTGDYVDHILFAHAYAEDFLWASSGGAIGTIGASGFTHTNYNNVFNGGMLNSFYRDDIWEIGWALNRGKMEMYRHFALFNDVQDPQVPSLLVWEAHAYQFNLIGDAGTELWTGVPRQLTVEHPDSIATGENRFSVQVRDTESDEPIPEVRVTLVSADEILRKDWTDNGGWVHFAFIPGELQEGALQLTTLKHNHIPYLTDVQVTSPQTYLGFSSLTIDDDDVGLSRGNNDGLAGPGETLELRTNLMTFGNQAPQGAITCILTRVMGDADTLRGTVVLRQAPQPGEQALVTFVVRVGQNNINGQRALFHLQNSSGQEIWRSALEFSIAAPNLEYARHSFNPNRFNPGDTTTVEVTLRNIGAVRSSIMHSTLISGREVVNVFEGVDDFSAIDPEGNDSVAAAQFRIHAHSLTVPGTPVEMILALADDEGFADTARFSFTIGRAVQGTPFGPDAYGYVCFDDADTLWEAAPEYSWIEIAPDLGGQGTDTEIRDLGNEEDFSVLVDLPFDFRYYGQEFRQLTICSNGWLAFGDESKLSDFHNRRIPPALGPRAQVCVFWDDLVNYVGEEEQPIGGIYYWFDEDSARFIVEWSRMRRYIGHDEEGNLRPGSQNTFQAILYDPQRYPTYTGDGDIEFQYLEVHNDRDVDPLEFDTPYATVGIVNLNGTDGMEYTYWNRYAAGASILQNSRAILFSTKLIVVVGCAEGRVVDVATGEPIPGAEVSGSKGSFARTRRDGGFFMDNVLIGEDYAFTAWAPGYNEQTLEGFDIAENDTVHLQFALRHPEFVLSRNQVVAEVQPGFGAEEGIVLTNSGNGPLKFRSFLDYPPEQQGNRWEKLLEINVTALTGDDRINGVGFLDRRFWVAGSNGRENPNRFYLFNREGALRVVYDQPSRSAYGFRDLAMAYGLLWGGENQVILGVDSLGIVRDSIPGLLTLQRAIAYDQNDHFWIANGRDEPLIKIDRQGNVVHSFRHELDIQGLGWLADDPDGFPLYILSRDKTNPALQVPLALVSKFNPVTEALRSVTPLDAAIEDRGGGMEITSGFDPHKWIMLAVLNNSDGDKVAAYDLGPNTDWISYQPRSGELEAGQATVIYMLLSTVGLSIGEYQLILRYQHNAAGLRSDIPITLRIGEGYGLSDSDSPPLNFGLKPNYPNPFNAVTTIPFYLPEAGNINLALFDLSGRELKVIAEGLYPAGSYRAVWDASELPSGIYIVRLEAQNRTAKIKLAVIR